ncbi:MAG: calcium:proton exchanger [Lachnospiraceae bacterium]|nr:calcium:proton exchanger [Lachnospiraceae bacterium]
MEKRKRKISYIRKPFARRSLFSLPLALMALVLAGVSLWISVRMQGNGDLSIAGWACSSLLFALTAVIYGLLSFFEEEKNYMLARIGAGIGGILVLFWICIILVGVLA